MLIHRSHAAAALVALLCLGRTAATQESTGPGELAAPMESAERCLAARDSIAAANDIRACSAYTLAMANHAQGQSQIELLSATYALDSLADRIEVGHGLSTPAATHTTFARTEYALARAHADAAEDQWSSRAAAATGRELRLSIEAVTASLAERNHRADRRTAARIQKIATVADAMEHGGAFTGADVVHALIALYRVLMVTRF